MDNILDELLREEDSEDEKLKHFIERTEKHIELVQRAVGKIAEANPEFREFDSTELVKNAEVHDESKLVEPEKDPYIELTWQHKTDGYKNYKKPGDIPQEDINQATLHHVTTNDHHPEFWLKDKGQANISKTDRDKSDRVVDASRMTGDAVVEMVADWQAMSEELKTNTAREWFDKQKNVRWRFSDDHEVLIDKLLKVFE